jgi:hypothetical protein
MPEGVAPEDDEVVSLKIGVAYKEVEQTRGKYLVLQTKVVCMEKEGHEKI